MAETSSFGSNFMSGLRSLGSQLKNDFNHQTGRKLYTGADKKSFDDRTQNRINNETNRGFTMAELRARNQRQRDKRAAAEEAEAATGAVEETDLSAFAANKKRYDDYLAQKKSDEDTKIKMDRARMMYERQNRGAGPVPRQMQGLNQFRNPQMRRMMAPGTGGSGVQQGLNPPPPMQDDGYRGDGTNFGRVAPQYRQGYQPAVMPRMPMPRPMPQNPASSPAFRYAGQNYDRLGGQQRMYDRPGEMMSQRDRQGVRDIYDNMDRSERFRPMPMPGPDNFGQQGGQQGIASLIQNMMSNKGGGRTAPQPQMPRYQTMRPQAPSRGRPMQSYGGKGAGQTMPQQSDFGRTLANRFGGLR